MAFSLDDDNVVLHERGGSQDYATVITGVNTDPFYQGKAGTAIITGSTGDDTYGTNEAGEDFVWIAKRHMGR